MISEMIIYIHTVSTLFFIYLKKFFICSKTFKTLIFAERISSPNHLKL